MNKRLIAVVIGTLIAFACSVVGSLAFDGRPMTAAEAFLLGFIGAWCVDTAHVEGSKQGGGE